MQETIKMPLQKERPGNQSFKYPEADCIQRIILKGNSGSCRVFNALDAFFINAIVLEQN